MNRARFACCVVAVLALISTAPMASFSWAAGPATAPAAGAAYNYKPGVDKVMNELRDVATRDSAERIMRGFPEVALPIAHADLTTSLADLPADVTAEATRILDRNHDARAFARKLTSADTVWNEGSAKSQYAAVGHHSPAWDANVVTAIVSVIEGKPNVKLMATLDAAGCDDPLYKYFRGRAAQNAKDPTAPKRLDDAAEAMLASDYPASRKLFALANDVKAHVSTGTAGLTADERKQLTDRAQKALSLYADAVKDPGIPTARLYELANTLQIDFFELLGDRFAAYQTVYPVVSAALPRSVVPLELKGFVYLGYAWDARGNGYADTITPAGLKLMTERLGVARDVLTQASKMDSYDVQPPTLMIGVAAADGQGKDEIQKWFCLAIEANPDYMDPYSEKMGFLEPKWYGSADDMLAFGRECVATQNFTPGIPLQLTYAHMTLATYHGLPTNGVTPDPAYYKGNAVAWADIQAAIDPILDVYPTDASYRTILARYAVLCGQYDEANKQFKILGDKVDATRFASPAEMNAMRQEAAEHAQPQGGGL